MKRGKPSFEEIKDELLPKCEKIYGSLWEKFEEDQRFYELNFKGNLNIPTEFASEGVVLPTARDFVDTFVDYIDIANARVYVPRKKATKEAIEEAEMMEKCYLGLIYTTNVESDISPWRVAAKHYALHGLAVLKTVWDADRWPDKPARKDGESDKAYEGRLEEWQGYTQETLPIVIQAINPRCIMPDPSYGGRMFVIEKHKKIVMDVSKRWPHWGNPKGRNVDEEVDYISYWDDTYRCDFIDGEPVLKGGVAKHSYGFIPYVFIDSGLGNVSYDAKPEQRYVGILRYIPDLLISESRDYSIDDIVLAKEAWPWYTLEGDNAEQVTEIKHTFGTTTTLPPGTKVVQQTPAIPPEALRAHLDRTSYYLSAHAAPNVLRGLPEPNVRSGAHERYRVGQAAARYRYSGEAFKHGTAKALINCVKLIKNVVPGNVWVWARTPRGEFDLEIKKDKMREPFNCHVEFAPISSEDEYRRQDSLRVLVDSGIIDKEFARTQMPNVDPLAMGRRERKEMLRQSPSYLQIIDQLMAAKAQEAVGALGGGIPAGAPPVTGVPQQTPGGMVSPIPQRAPPGSAEEAQNRLRQLQRPSTTGQGEGGGGARGATR